MGGNVGCTLVGYVISCVNLLLSAMLFWSVATVGDPDPDEDTTSPEMDVQEQEELIQRGTIYSPESMNSAGYIHNDTGHDLLHR